MMQQAGIRQLFWSVVLSACVVAGAAQERRPDADAQNTSSKDEPAVAFKEAEEYFRRGSFDQAIAKYNDTLKSDPQSMAAYTGIVRCYLKQDKVRDAAQTLEKGLHAQPTDPGLKVAQGELLFRQGKIHESEEILVQLINRGKAPARAYLGLA